MVQLRSWRLVLVLLVVCGCGAKGLEGTWVGTPLGVESAGNSQLRPKLELKPNHQFRLTFHNGTFQGTWHHVGNRVSINVEQATAADGAATAAQNNIECSVESGGSELLMTFGNSLSFTFTRE